MNRLQLIWTGCNGLGACRRLCGVVAGVVLLFPAIVEQKLAAQETAPQERSAEPLPSGLFAPTAPQKAVASNSLSSEAVANAVAGPCPSNIVRLNSTTVDGIPGNGTPDDLVMALLGPGVTVANIQYRGLVSSAGTFSGFASAVGIDQGIILSTGNVTNVIGPNTLSNATQDNGLPGDSDLNALIPGYTTYDATVLEFDFIPDQNVISFSYVFASEEYDEFVNTIYNDVFGFFVNGTNVARLPATTTTSYAVSINNVNHGNPTGNTTQSNPQYHVDNTDGHLCTQMDGLTVVLSATASVIPHVVNHMKLTIADAGDHVLDSDVFIQGGSFAANHPPTIICPSAVSTNYGAPEIMNAQVTDLDGDPIQVIWQINGIAQQTNNVPGTPPVTSATVGFSEVFPVGTNTVTVVASDGKAVTTCGTLVVVAPPLLEVRKTSLTEHTNVAIGEQFQYEITFDTFLTSAAAQQLNLVDYLPPELDVVGFTSQGAISVAYNPALNTITWDFGTWPPLSQGPTNYVTVKLNSLAVGESNVVNYVTLSSSNLPPVSGRDPNPRCPGCTGIDVCPAPQVTITPVANKGYYQLAATSTCYDSSQLQFYVRDTASAFVAGPYPSGTVVKTKKSATTGIGPASGVASVTIMVLGNGQVYAVDPGGQVSSVTICKSL